MPELSAEPSSLSARPSQSSSVFAVSHTSVAPGFTAATASLQSVDVPTYPLGTSQNAPVVVPP